VGEGPEGEGDEALTGVRQRKWTRIGLILAAPLVLLVSCQCVDQILMSAARPPPNVKTLQDFQAWKRDAITGMRTFERAGVNYTVMLAPAGRFLPSGPAGYLFDDHGRFVDWTPDLGDFKASSKGWDFMGGAVKNIELGTNRPTSR
jgi:hypothetical protein